MTPEEALRIVDQAAGKAILSRHDHIIVQQAMQVLVEAIKPKVEEPAEEEKEGEG